MKLSKEDARDMIRNGLEDWDMVQNSEKIVDQRRWVTVFEAIFEHKPSGKFYSMSWEAGSTEGQDEQPFEYYEPELIEVELKEVIVKEWKPV